MIETIKHFIIEELEKKQALPPNININEYRFLDEGHIDSLASMTFILRIEDEFNVEFSQEDIVSEEFRTVGGLASIIERKRQENK